jgi:hypothetical protein
MDTRTLREVSELPIDLKLTLATAVATKLRDFEKMIEQGCDDPYIASETETLRKLHELMGDAFAVQIVHYMK